MTYSVPTALLSVALLVGLLGCATAPPRPSAQLRAQLGTIGVASDARPHMAALRAPARGTGAGAAEGAKKAALGTLKVGADAHSVVIDAPIIAATPVTTLVGTLYGAVAADSRADVEAAESIVRKVAETATVAEGLRDHIVLLGRERTGHRFMGAGDDLDDVTAEPQTVLTLRLVRFILDASGINPRVPLRLVVQAHLVRVEDMRLIFGREWAYESPDKRRFSEWTTGDGKPVRDELERASRHLAAEIVEELFVR